MARLTDDGVTVVLDLHGTRLDEALRLARRAATLAGQRGRHRLDLIHGTSTTEADPLRPTIKRSLQAWAEAGIPGVQSTRAADTVLSCFFALGRPRDPRRLALRDVLA